MNEKDRHLRALLVPFQADQAHWMHIGRRVANCLLASGHLRRARTRSGFALTAVGLVFLERTRPSALRAAGNAA